MLLLCTWEPHGAATDEEDAEMTTSTSYYITSSEYVGPNVAERPNSKRYYITTVAPRTNMSHEIRVSGWLGTTSDISEYACGEFETLESATAALDEITGDDYRDADDSDRLIGCSADGEPIEALVCRIAGALEQWGAQASKDWCHAAMLEDVTASTTDDEIDAMVAELYADLGREMNAALSTGAVEKMYQTRRDELVAEAKAEAEADAESED